MRTGLVLKHMLRVLLGLVVIVMMVPILANAYGVTCRTHGDVCLYPNDFFDWRHNFGPPFSDIPNGSFIESVNGYADGAFVHFERGGDGQRRDEGIGWHGNFIPGEHLLWTNGQGPLTFNFSGGVYGAGVQVQAHFPGPFTALMQAYDENGNLMDSFSEDGNSNGNQDGSAIYIGLAEGGDLIHILTLSLTNANGDPNDFAINQLDVIGFPPDEIPEPASLWLAGSGLLSMAAIGRKRLGKHS